jgi:hypothetical protein
VWTGDTTRDASPPHFAGAGVIGDPLREHEPVDNRSDGFVF